MQPRVIAVPCLSDNYAYLVHAPGSTDAIVVDASEEEPVTLALEREGLRPVAILSTHHHFDHVGGNEALARKFPGLEIVASAHDKDRVPARTAIVDDGDEVSCAGLPVHAISVPGHTLGAVAYVIGDAVFTGDTLFVAGCGRLFEGTPAMMYRSLCERLATLPASTRVYCGHEYTVSNARFALSVDAENPAVRALLDRATQQRERGEPTVPSTMADERAHNPFLRVAEPALVRSAAGPTDPVGVLGAIRKKKDEFRS
jgi:hydroxyacylglutathione hydrolase